MLAKWHEPSPGLGYIDLGVREAQTSLNVAAGISRFAIFRHQAGNIGTMTASSKLGASTERSTQYFACLVLACRLWTLFVILTLWHSSNRGRILSYSNIPVISLVTTKQLVSEDQGYAVYPEFHPLKREENSFLLTLFRTNGTHVSSNTHIHGGKNHTRLRCPTMHV